MISYYYMDKFVLVSVLIIVNISITCELVYGQTSTTAILFPTDNTKFEGSVCETSSGRKGICRRVINCLDSDEKITTGTEDICSFDKNEPIYCCAVDQLLDTDIRFGADRTESTENAVDSVIRIPSRPAEEICEQYYPTRDKTENLHGTHEAVSSMSTHSNSYLAAIGWNHKNISIDWKCTGVVISRNMILTDALCLSSKESHPEFAKVEMINEVNDALTATVIFNIISVYVHPDFRSYEVYHNLALMKIGSEYPLSIRNKPACLWTTELLPKTELFRLGYTDSHMQETFRQNVSILQKENCSEKVSGSFDVPRGITQDVFCSSTKERCHNDFGGPVEIVWARESSPRPAIVGFTSFGHYCNIPSPIIYTRISAYLDWIEPFFIREL